MREKLGEIFKKSIIQVVFPVLVGAATFVLSKSKYDQEVVADELANVQTAITIYKDMAFYLKDENELLKSRLLELEKSVKYLQENCK